MTKKLFDHAKQQWQETGVVTDVRPNRSFEVATEKGSSLIRNRRDLKLTPASEHRSTLIVREKETPTTPVSPHKERLISTPVSAHKEMLTSSEKTPSARSPTPEPTLRRSIRNRAKPQRLIEEV